MRCPAWFRRTLPPAGLALAFLLPIAAVAGAQEPAEAPAGQSLRVFLDCQAFCDLTYIRRELIWVDWVRDREDADVHVLVTTEGTGGGGGRYTLAFLGRGEHEGRDDEFTHTYRGDAVQDEIREGLTRVLALGLVPYAQGTPAFEQLRVDYQIAEGTGPQAAAATRPEDDPWDFWVFNLAASGRFSSESQQSQSSRNGSLSANRTTEDWKFNLGGSYRRTVREFELTEGTSRFVTETWDASSLLVKSMGEHWSLGARAETGASTFSNIDWQWSLKPGVEYNFYPYAESARRELTLQYLVGVNHWDYEKETLFNETAETRFSHEAVLGLNLTQPWGQSYVSIRGSQYLHDASKYSVNIFGTLDIRLFKGLSFNVSGNYSWIRDQLNIVKGDISDDEILTRQRELATSFRYSTSFGLRYRFGSIFNNVVNPRFGGGGPVFFFF